MYPDISGAPRRSSKGPESVVVQMGSYSNKATMALGKRQSACAIASLAICNTNIQRSHGPFMYIDQELPVRSRPVQDMSGLYRTLFKWPTTAW